MEGGLYLRGGPGYSSVDPHPCPQSPLTLKNLRSSGIYFSPAVRHPRSLLLKNQGRPSPPSARSGVPRTRTHSNIGYSQRHRAAGGQRPCTGQGGALSEKQVMSRIRIAGQATRHMQVGGQGDVRLCSALHRGEKCSLCK